MLKIILYVLVAENKLPLPLILCAGVQEKSGLSAGRGECWRAAARRAAGGAVAGHGIVCPWVSEIQQQVSQGRVLGF